jgi:1-acyl-sn-glycerol-3-phosphate acyltransferase
MTFTLTLCFIIFSQCIAIMALIIYLLTGLNAPWIVDKILAITLLKIKIFKHKISAPLDKKTRIILANHRLFTDFFLDSYLIGDSSQLSRYSVALALPGAGLYGWLSGRVLFFKRGSTGHRSLAMKIAEHFDFRATPMIFYPEGHRNTLPKSLDLKPGGIKMCFERGWPIQLSITSGKEEVLNEKTFSLSLNKKCYSILTESITPQDFTRPEDFYAGVLKKWKETWELVYTSDRTDFIPYIPKPIKAKFDFSYRWLFSWGVLLTIALGYYILSKYNFYKILS